ncbi:site-specific integrase [Ferrimicrobium acidiphilum]|uniref:Uncharacterized protein n=1 Tax=Ferrimicrobium acidiphilum DSM 19497 TaxID=1121877 RepID=A0A0D8FVK0_9ACTN|nr:site-specific integrase [Ferrimicrobium acidiphilum]KJE76267.1 hypothetical protein FEAC_20020 [Ferrimicrobium acidiphilum DSM 19497]
MHGDSRPVAVSETSLARLRTEIAATLKIGEEELVNGLRHLEEASPSEWDREFRTRRSLEVRVSALLALEGVDGIGLPRILDDFTRTTAFQRSLAALGQQFPNEVPNLERVLRQLFRIIPRLTDFPEALGVLELLYSGSPPSSMLQLLKILGPEPRLEMNGEQITAREVASRIRRGYGGVEYGWLVVRSGLIPSTFAGLCEGLLGRKTSDAALAPLRWLCTSSPAAAAMLAYLGPRRLASWERLVRVGRHCERLSRVAGLDATPVISPGLEHVRRLVVDSEVAFRYDEALAQDAATLEKMFRLQGCDTDTARERAMKRVMEGFQPFVTYLEQAQRFGASVLAFPCGLQGHRIQSFWQAPRDDLAPDQLTAVSILALAPKLLAGEAYGKLIILQILSCARASVVLGLRRSYVVVTREGWLIHVPWKANKTGSAVLFIAEAFLEGFGINLDWLPIDAPEEPSDASRRDFASAIERMCSRYQLMTDQRIPHQDIRFTRPMMAKLLADALTPDDFAPITAILGHSRGEMRLNYLRPNVAEAARYLGSWGHHG